MGLLARGFRSKPFNAVLEAHLAPWRDGEFAGNNCDIPKSMLTGASPTQMISAAALLAEVGRLNDAVLTVERALRLDRHILTRCRYAGLTGVLGAMCPDLVIRHGADVLAAERFRSFAGTFARLVKESDGSIAVVGNSPAELGRGRGEEIDRRRLVVRFNSFSTAPEFRADFGSKVDVWSRDINYRNMRRRDSERFQVELLPIPVYWRVKNGQDALVDAMLRDATIEEVPQTLHSELRTKLGAPPSSGLSVLYWLRELLGSLDDVLIAGFSLSDQVSGPTHYSSVPPLKAPPPHDWQRERAFFDDLIKA